MPSQRVSSLQDLDAVPVERLPTVNTDALRAEDEGQRGEIEPYRYGTVVAMSATPERAGTWERLPSGDWLWRLRVHSDSARSLSLGFSSFELPDEARLFVHDGAGTTVRGPYTNADATNGQHRTPLVRGEEIVVELVVPDGRRSAVDLRLDRVVHGYRSIRPTDQTEPSAKSGTCNLDVACDKADSWRKQVRSVGLYSFETDGGAFVCTGSLMNNTAEDERPFFLTAEHCVTSASVASTMVFYWNYQNPTCRTPGSGESGTVTDDDKLDQTSSGAVLRARYGSVHEDGQISGKSDLALVEVDDTIPPRYNLFFNGWSREGNSTSESVTIHHPSGHGKRISFDQDPSSITGYATDSGGDTHLRIGNWETGTTEGGSSGSPLYDSNKRVVGVLSGGLAGCGGDGDADDNDEPDWYGRISPGFKNGDYQGNTLADWLDPTGSGTLVLDGQPQSDVPRPDPPTNVTATTTPDSVTLDWQPSDSADVVQYRVYRDTAPIDSTTGPPTVPVYDSVAASRTRYTDTGVAVDEQYHYRFTAKDAGGTESATSDSARVFLYPPQVTAAIERSFDNTTSSSGYRLVALPGTVNRPLADAIAGEAGKDWQAYWDDGSDRNFRVRYDGSDTFTFTPGTGFWLTSTQTWTDSVRVPTVALRGDSAAIVDLHDGWNILSNPTGKDVAWSRVQAQTPDPLQAIWGFDGAFTRADTFRSAREGVAYYFFNDDSTRTELVVPYPGAPNSDAASKTGSEEPSLLALTARPADREDAPSSTVKLGIGDHAVRGLGSEDLVAPPGRFAATSLRLVVPNSNELGRTRFLMTERRPPSSKADGHTFALQLTSRTEGPVQVSASGLASLNGREAALLHPSAGTAYDLQATPSVQVEPRTPTTTLRVAVGSKDYVQDETDDVLPAKVKLTSYPNPMAGSGTLVYALPERTTVTLRVYDVLGRQVATLASGPKRAGRHPVRLNTDDLSSGVYFGRLQAGGRTLTRKITVIR